jgi:polysaccharide deacetylase 2 family uncharacterized protein YibQ
MQIYITLLFIFLACLPATSEGQVPEIALIIDDMGNNQQDAMAFNLPANVTFAILPNKPLSKIFSERALLQNREVILHMPMESLEGIKQEEGSLLVGMSAENMRAALVVALKSVPFATGLNNHMGSRLTQLDEPMAVTMTFLLEHGLYFVDSRTTKFTLAETMANKTGVLTSKRDVFLDHHADLPNMLKQFKRLIAIAKKQGRAVAIAHPYPQTLQFLKDYLPGIENQGIRLVKLGDIVLETANIAKSDNLHRDDVAITQ